MRRSIALVSVAGLTLLGLSVQASAIVPGSNGRILFARCIAPYKCFDKSSTVRTWEIVAANPDDTNETVLAGPYPPGAWDDHFIANWSPDGKTAIFMADLGQGQAIWQVNADGTGLHELLHATSDGNGFDDGPAFTPDGQHIVFTRCCPKNSGYSLWIMNADGTNLRKLTSENVPPSVDGPSDNLPQVSPDGTSIAYHRNVVDTRNAADLGNRIVVVNINGGNSRDLTDPALNAQVPNWSPDSKKIVFETNPEGSFTQIAVINADGTGYKQLTFGGTKTASIAPSFSPDGTKIVFTRCPSTSFCDRFSMNPGWQRCYADHKDGRWGVLAAVGARVRIGCSRASSSPSVKRTRRTSSRRTSRRPRPPARTSCDDRIAHTCGSGSAAARSRRLLLTAGLDLGR